MAKSGTGTIITIVIILAVAVGVVFFLGRRKANAAGAVTGGGAGARPPGFGSPVDFVLQNIPKTLTQREPTVPRAGLSLPPPAVPADGSAPPEPSMPATPPPPPPAVGASQSDVERYARSAF